MELSHVNENGQAHMVDVTAKAVTNRRATAVSFIRMKPETLRLIRENQIKKGDVLATARIAGIMAVKQTPELIPLCHPLLITSVTVDFEYQGETTIKIMTEVRTTGQTGVEMEALTGASVAALTIYDMCKAVDKGMTIEQTRLEMKEGGKSGTYRRSVDG
ncbi:MAG: cyclic pyranopterin monophosphate synthase MoaC [Dehalogenimonas sp.]|uniref:Cyclic pyranopterin monophosphate synthase n=1 Tax=Candidatus Dehalogenimonas loeffleri TaxID=3127115 RepID=A0ABZ2J950_9CHLR|nr:cyclic pyranopterin monophosphate synthase MoaC [Dehalogenimonas sp.]